MIVATSSGNLGHKVPAIQHPLLQTGTGTGVNPQLTIGQALLLQLARHYWACLLHDVQHIGICSSQPLQAAGHHRCSVVASQPLGRCPVPASAACGVGRTRKDGDCGDLALQTLAGRPTNKNEVQRMPPGCRSNSRCALPLPHLLATHCAACATATSPGAPLGASPPVAAACRVTTARRSARRPVSVQSRWMDDAGQGWTWGAASTAAAAAGDADRTWVAGIAARWVVAEQPPRLPAVSGQAGRTCGRQHAQRAVRHQRVAAHGGQQLQQRARQRHRLPHRRHVLHLLPPGWSHGVDAHLGGAGAGAGRRGQTRRARPAARCKPAVWAQSPAGGMPRGRTGKRFRAGPVRFTSWLSSTTSASISMVHTWPASAPSSAEASLPTTTPAVREQ